MTPSKTRNHPLNRATAAGHPAFWCGLAGVLVWLDIVTGPNVYISIMFVAPVALAAWHRGLRWALPLALAQAAVSYGHSWFFESLSPFILAANFLICAATLAAAAGLVAQTARQRRRIEKLEQSLPICAWCRKIHSDNSWLTLDRYLGERSQILFTHCICPACKSQQVFPEPYN